MPHKGPKKSDLTCDVLVVGGGTGGTAAAIWSARQGADTLPVGAGVDQMQEAVGDPLHTQRVPAKAFEVRPHFIRPHRHHAVAGNDVKVRVGRGDGVGVRA